MKDAKNTKIIPLAEQMFERYGPVIRGAELRNILGYNSPQSFGRALKNELLDLPIFSIPGRRGFCAMTNDVAEYLESCKLRGMLSRVG